MKPGSQHVGPRAHDWHFQRPPEPQSEPKSCWISSRVSGPLECPSRQRLCVPPTLGVSCCQGDINKAGCALSSALRLQVFFFFSSPDDVYCCVSGKRWHCCQASTIIYPNTELSQTQWMLFFFFFSAVMFFKKKIGWQHVPELIESSYLARWLVTSQ